MVERGRRPRHYGVALRAVLGEGRCYMVGVGCALKILEMASDAGRAG